MLREKFSLFHIGCIVSVNLFAVLISDHLLCFRGPVKPCLLPVINVNHNSFV